MNHTVFFSPTGGTEDVVHYIGSFYRPTKDIDLSTDIFPCEMGKDDFCIVGVPSFGGRVPEIAVKRLGSLHGNQTPVLLVVTYGNRAYEDTLKELKTVLEAQGFLCVGAITVVTRHSIMKSYGEGRPNRKDLEAIGTFVDDLKRSLPFVSKSVDVPGNVPYKKRNVIPMHPWTTEDCIKCGLCANLCPVHAIPVTRPECTDNTKCISCMRCVKKCPHQARKIDEEKVLHMIEKMRAVCSVHKECEFFK